MKNNKTKTQDEFVKSLKNKYKDLIDYSYINYVGTHNKIILKCQKCNFIFERIPKDLLYNIKIDNICPKCSKEHIKNKNTIKFIEKSKEIHNNKYDYSMIDYTNSKTKVCIICHEKDEFGEEHGEFWQIPNSHLNGHGCPKSKNNYNRLKRNDFIRKAKLIHDNYYDYQNVIYQNNHIYVEIICPKHGIFLMQPRVHLKGCGCPKCKKSWLERETGKFLDNNKIKYEEQKTFTWLKNKNSHLYLDFYLPDYNIAIECQGEQHFRPIKYYGGIEKYHKVLINDLLKIKRCNEHNIKIIHISDYKNFSNKINKQWEYYNVIINKDELLSYINNSKE